MRRWEGVRKGVRNHPGHTWKGGMYWRLRRSEGVSGQDGCIFAWWVGVSDGVCGETVTTETFDRSKVYRGKGI